MGNKIKDTIAASITGNAGGNAGTATTLQTARTINGTSFNGSANITTSSWGTARDITIGNTKKSVNGSAAVSWSLTEIGAAPASHGTHVSYGGNGSASTVSRSDHTHNYAASGHTHSYAGSAVEGGAANSVKTNLTIKLNSGSTEGTNLFTFNGSTAKSINITPSAIGAAASSHTHTVLTVKSDNYKLETDLPSTYERGETLFFSNSPSSGKFNGMTYGLVQTLKEYSSGSAAWQFLYPYNSNEGHFYVRQAMYGTDAWKGWAEVYTSLNKPTAADIGAAAASHGTHLTIGTGASNAAAGNHTHSYAGSSSAGGAANSVKTNLTIKLNSGSTEGTNLFTFNGSTAKTVNITPSAIGAAASSHGTHLTIGTGASNAAAGNHTHSYLPLSGGTMTGAIVFNCAKGITTKTNADYTNTNSSATVAAGTTMSTLVYNTSGNCHLNSGAFDNYLNTGNLYMSSPNAAYIRTRNSGTQYFQINDASVAYFSTSEAAFAKNINAKAGMTIWDGKKITLSSNTSHNKAAIGVETSTGDVYISNINNNWFRIKGDKTLTIAGSKVYTALDKPTASEIGALPTAGGTMTGAISSSVATGTYLKGNQGTAIINSTNTAGAYTTIFKTNSTNGYFTLSNYNGTLLLNYTAKSVVDAGTNSTSKQATLMNESGSAVWPNSITANGGVASGAVVYATGGMYSKAGTFGLADSAGATFLCCFRNASSRAICDLGHNTLPGRLYIRSGQGTGGSGVSVECAVTNGTNYVQYLSPEAGTIALTKHLSDRTRKENIAYVDTEECGFSNKDFYDFIRDNLDLATYTLKKEYAATDTHTKLNFIAQDILWDFNKNEESKVGNLIVQAEDAMEEQLSLKYDPEIFTGVIAGALKESISKIEELEDKNKKLEEKLASLEERLLKLENK